MFKNHSRIFVDFPLFFDSARDIFESFEMVQRARPESKLSVSNYPVCNIMFDKHGIAILELAVTGFQKEDLMVEQDGQSLVVTGKRSGGSYYDDMKMLVNNIAQRDFENRYPFDNAYDLSKTSTALRNGILSIYVPLKEEEQAKKRTFDIK